jgi:hypothetical protein
MLRPGSLAVGYSAVSGNSARVLDGCFKLSIIHFGVVINAFFNSLLRSRETVLNGDALPQQRGQLLSRQVSERLVPGPLAPLNQAAVKIRLNPRADKVCDGNSVSGQESSFRDQNPTHPPQPVNGPTWHRLVGVVRTAAGRWKRRKQRTNTNTGAIGASAQAGVRPCETHLFGSWNMGCSLRSRKPSFAKEARLAAA